MQTVMQADVARIPAPSTAPGQTGKAKEPDGGGFFSLLNAIANDGAAEGNAETAKASRDDESGALQAGMALLAVLQAMQPQAQSTEEGLQAAGPDGAATAGTGLLTTAQEAAQTIPADLLKALAGIEGTAAADAGETAAGLDDLIEALRQALEEAPAQAQPAADASASAKASAIAPEKPGSDALADPKTLIERLASAAKEDGNTVAQPAAKLTDAAAAASRDVGTAATQAAANVQQESGKAAAPDGAAVNAAQESVPDTGVIQSAQQGTADAKQGIADAKQGTETQMPAQAADTGRDAGGTDTGGRETAAKTVQPVPAEAYVQTTIKQDAGAVQADAPVRAGSETTATAGDILAQLVEKATAGIKDGKYQMSLQLRPEHLGKVSVNVTMEAEGMVVKIHAQKEAAESAISSQVAQLEQALKDRGITVVRMEVQEHLQDGAGQPGSQNDPRRNRREYSTQGDGDAEAGLETFTALQEYIYGNTVEFQA